MANVSYNEMIKCKTLFEYYGDDIIKKAKDSVINDDVEVYSVNNK